MAVSDGVKALFALFTSGEISPAAFFKQSGRKYIIRSGGYRDNSKWSRNELRDIRARNGVGRPPAVIKARREAAAS